MYYKELDGLRGVAAVNVMVAHFVCAFLPSLMSNNYPTVFVQPENPSALHILLSSPLTTIFYNGHFAVMLFFVLSGFVLTVPYFQNNIQSIKSRLWVRYIRLGLPVSMSILIGYLFVNFGLFQNKEAAIISGSTTWLANFYNDISFLEFLKNAVYKGLVLGDGRLNPPLWTLKIEFIGSLLLLAFYIVKPKGHEFLYALALCLLLLTTIGSDSVYYIALFLGALINTVSSLRFKWCFFVVGIYFAGYQYDSEYYSLLIKFGSYDDKNIYNILAAFLIVLSVKFGCLKNILTSRFCQFLGKTSFSAYLLHMIFLCSIISYFYVEFVTSLMGLIMLFFGYVCLVYSSSLLYYHLVDRRAVTLAHLLSNKLIRV